jgi:hypothetical protein
MTCTAVQLSLGGSKVPQTTPDNTMALLDMKGRWVVSSWPNVEWSAENGAEPLVKCVAQELLAARASVVRNVTPDFTCPPALNAEGHFGIWSWSQMQHVIDTDPIMRACQKTARVRCDPGDTCS